MRRPRMGARWKLAAALCVVVAPVGAAASTLLGSVAHPTATHRAMHARFSISGDLTVPLRPGLWRPLRLRLANPRRFPLWVTRVKTTLSVDRAHAAAGCVAATNFWTSPIPRASFPIRVPPGPARTLRALGVRRAPRIGMRDLPDVDQGACKGARIRLRYVGTAVRRARRR